MKKKLSVVIVTALFIFSVVGNVFAWTSFQNSNYLNNGLIDDGYTYPTTTPSVNVYTDLTRAGWSGIECAPVVQVENNVPYAYVLHSATGGAKVAKINLTSPGTVPAGWVQDGIQVNTSTAFQMSTPIIVGDTLYCAGNVFANIVRNDEFAEYNSGAFDEWAITPGTGVSCTQSSITLTDGTVKEALKAYASASGDYSISAYQSGYSMTSAQLNNLRIAGGVKFTDVSQAIVYVYINGSLNKTFVYNTTLSGAIDLVEDNGIYCWNENTTAPSATTKSMEVVINYTTTSANGCIELDYAEMYDQSAGIGKIDGISSTTSPDTVTYVGLTGDISGQINTPISSDGTYLYFGNYLASGNGHYYKVRMSDGNTTSFELTNNSTYWAGAAICGDYLVFGSEKGVLYVLNKSDMTLKTSVTLTGTPLIRSTICAVQSGSSYNLYFTSRTNNSGTLWCYNLSSSGALTEYWSQTSIGYTNSTPTVSGNYIYVGGSAGVFCVDYLGEIVWKTSSDTALVNVIKGVQASPVVYSVISGSTVTDYIYVTTNQANGQCYCIKYVQGATVVQTGTNKNPDLVWSTSVAQGTSGATYTLQGVAAGGGYLVFGNDYANLVIMYIQ